ncbi:hypothetical protein P262_02474 [Cronobacter malonaticus]|uniref:Uncharacterized protein n=1 Tax=Cronobacter malonaticus TaxID=413503 RepID=V5TYC5_9ENTR|nr:hypothetical protein P262_02474 [Cronobacter malonaticus]
MWNTNSFRASRKRSVNSDAHNALFDKWILNENAFFASLNAKLACSRKKA